jgi:DNA topoisomerase IB
MRASSDEFNTLDAVNSAEAASLVYCSDIEPGIHRRRSGKQFLW